MCFRQSTYTMLSSQAVGIITVMAISGSVALLALGKHKLYPYPFKNYILERIDDGNQDTAMDLSSSSCVLTALPGASRSKCSSERRSSDTVNSCDTYYITLEDQIWQKGESHGGERRGADLNDLEHDRCLVTSDISATGLPEFVSRPASSCPSVLTNSTATKQHSPQAGEKERPHPAVAKKVRFCADVAEPSGSSQEYRRRMKTVLTSKTEDANKPKSSKPQRHAETPSSDTDRFPERKEGNSAHIPYQNSSRNAPETEWRSRTSSAPRIPPNRTALYTSLQQQHRLQQVSLYYCS